MPARYALGLGGGARRVKHQRQGVGRHARLGNGRRYRDHFGEGQFGPPGIGADSNPRDCDRPLAFGHRLACDGLEGDGLGVAVLQNEVDLIWLRAPVDRRDRQPGKLAGPVQARRFPAVLEHGDEVIAGFQAHAIECRDQRRNFVEPMRIGQADVAVDDGKRIGVPCRARHEAGAEVKHWQAPDPESAAQARPAGWQRPRAPP